MENASRNPTMAITHDAVSKFPDTAGTVGSGRPAGMSPMSVNGWLVPKSSPMDRLTNTVTRVANTTTTALRAVPRALTTLLRLPQRAYTHPTHHTKTDA